MIPLKIDSVPSRVPFVTVLIALLCVAALYGRHYVAPYGYGFVPVDFMHSLLHPGRATGDMVLTLGISFFQHAGVFHLVSNLWYLWIFGSAMEYALGWWLFALAYLACGVLSMVIQAVSSPLSTVPVVGASGAIAGVMGACLALLPMARIVMWFPPLLFLRVPSFLFLLLWFALQYVSMYHAAGSGGGIAWWAHIGGFACGALLGLAVRYRGWKPPRGLRKR